MLVRLPVARITPSSLPASQSQAASILGEPASVFRGGILLHEIACSLHRVSASSLASNLFENPVTCMCEHGK
jgi:hypothetical protein